MRLSVLGQDRSQTKKISLGLGLVRCGGFCLSLGLAQVWCSVVKHGLVTLDVIMLLTDSATLQVLFIVYLFCAWKITAVEINSGVYFLKSHIHQVPLFTSGALGPGLVILVLVLVLCSRP